MKWTMIILLSGLTITQTLASAKTTIFSGEKRLACEAVLCLLSGQRPNECTSALTRYFSIKIKKNGVFHPGRTLKARTKFLELCPKTDKPEPTKAAIPENASAKNMEPLATVLRQ